MRGRTGRPTAEESPRFRQKKNNFSAIFDALAVILILYRTLRAPPEGRFRFGLHVGRAIYRAPSQRAHFSQAPQTTLRAPPVVKTAAVVAALNQDTAARPHRRGHGRIYLTIFLANREERDRITGGTQAQSAAESLGGFACFGARHFTSGADWSAGDEGNAGRLTEKIFSSVVPATPTRGKGMIEREKKNSPRGGEGKLFVGVLQKTECGPTMVDKKRALLGKNLQNRMMTPRPCSDEERGRQLSVPGRGNRVL